MDVVAHTVEKRDDGEGGQAHEVGLHIVQLVAGASTDRVIVEATHSPAEGSTLAPKLGVVLLASLDHQELVIGLTSKVGSVLSVDVLAIGFRAEVLLLGGGGVGLAASGVTIVVSAVLDDCVVGNLGLLCVDRSWSVEKEGSVENIPCGEGVVPLDDLRVRPRNEEESSEDSETEAGSKGDGCDEPGWLVRQPESRGTLVDDGKGADGSSDEEEEGGGEDRPFYGILADVNHVFDEGVDDCAEAAGDEWRHSQT